MVLKHCEEMPYDLCDKWDETLKKVIIQKKKYVQGKDKCKLESVENDDEDDEGGFDFHFNDFDSE